MFCANLRQRGFIRITGEDALAFLQGIISNDVYKVTADNAVYACFLTPQGKYLADFFLYPVMGGLLLDVDQSLLADLLRRLLMYKLRSKVVLEDVSAEYSVTALWGGPEKPAEAFIDPRGMDFGFRVLNSDLSGNDHYALWQMQNGLPDAQDFERERTTMLEANMDFLNGVSFDKGCYMGQEITARMHYRALVKKRFLPLELLAGQEITRETPVMRDGKHIGYILNARENFALAVIQSEALQGGLDCVVDGMDATIKIPAWFKQDS
ncbi:MAG: hypothetical protein JWM96_788 [Alphaproteobacteria bacterium]|nr:hypothetical protein [Alphaproteobacteria bacterium]